MLNQNEFYAPFIPDEVKPYIFISYAHLDRDRVFPIITDLYESGYHIWYDEGLELGEDYYMQLEQHIKNCVVVLLFITENSIKRTFVTRSEVQYAINDVDKRIILCYLDEVNSLPDGMNIALADRDFHPRIHVQEIKSTLAKIGGLSQFAPRKAKGRTIRANNGIVISDDSEIYDFTKCDGGVKLTCYNGNETDVVIPAVYKGFPVVELGETFQRNKTVQTVHIPNSVKILHGYTFHLCPSLTDVYVPSTVQEIDKYAFSHSDCRIHGAKHSAAERFAMSKHNSFLSEEYEFVEDIELEDKPENNSSMTKEEKYVYCSYGDDISADVQQILRKLTEHNCSVFDCKRSTNDNHLKKLRKATCFIFFLSPKFVKETELEELYFAKNSGTPFFIFLMKDCTLPHDLNMILSSAQQLRYDKGTEHDRIAQLIGWIEKQNCRNTSADIPDFEYNATSDGITLTKYIGSSSAVVIPHAYDDVPVKAIGKRAFFKCKNITSVIIPEGLTNIGFGAFMYCQELTSIVIPNSITKIDENAFRSCGKLSSIVIPDSVSEIGEQAFAYCESLFSAIISNKVKCIENGTFAECSSLKSVIIPNDVKIIGESAFYNCENLSSILIPSSVVEIEYNSFESCDKLTVFCLRDSFAWNYCEANGIRHRTIEEWNDNQYFKEDVGEKVPERRRHWWNFF